MKTKSEETLKHRKIGEIRRGLRVRSRSLERAWSLVSYFFQLQTFSILQNSIFKLFKKSLLINFLSVESLL